MKWFVFTPPYEMYSDMTGYNYGSDIVEVIADTKRKALVEGLRELRRTQSQWIWRISGCPFTGLQAERSES